MVFALTFLVLMFLLYNYLLFNFIDTLLEEIRFKKIYRIPVWFLNTFLALALTMLNTSTTFLSYTIMGVMLFVEFIIFYKDKISSSLFCVLACMLHVMSIRSLCVAGFAIATNNTIYEVVNNEMLLVQSTAFTFLCLNIAIAFVKQFIPAKGIRIVKQHSDQLWFVTLWLSVFCAYLVINSMVYNILNTDPNLLLNQIAAPVAILIGTYIVLFFSIKMSTLLGYKEQTEKLQHVVEKERNYRTSIDKDVFRIIEVNFNKNYLLSGFEDYQDQLGDMINNYTNMLEFMIKETVHPDDREEFLKYSSPATVIDEFLQGKTEIAFEYRRLMPEGVYVWMRVLMPLMLDDNTGDVMGFVQIKNIDIEKKRQLMLEFQAERDMLTGLYNKVTTEKHIVEYLANNKTNLSSGVLFIIDIDNFKTINDRLGHLYGDAVLSELSESLRELFREDDIVGRIGGDEFLVFAKGALGHKMVARKAEDICKAFLRTYANELKQDYTVSSSIGIAFFPKDGTSFEELFKSADAALYTTKGKGKNNYSFYEKDFEMPYVPTRTEIDTQGVLQKNFKDNRIEYVFRLLYGSDDTKYAIESVLELIAKNFNFSRANIFEFNELSTHFNGVFEWCSTGTDSVINNYTDMPLENFDFIINMLEESGGMFAAVPTDFPAHAVESYTAIGIKSIVHFSIKERDKLIGVIAFQNCVDDNFVLYGTEFDELKTICQVLSVFMAKQLSSDREQRHHQAIETVMDNMNSIAYVVDRESYDVFYENQNVVNITGHSSIGNKCYRSYRGLDEPCPDCAMQHISEDNPRCTLELYTEKFDIYTKTSAALVDWSNDRKAFLISSVDITEYKKQGDKG